MSESTVDGRVAKGEATRAHIIACATDAFAEAGYAGTSIETLLARCGVSRGALYHHFGDKAAVFTAVVIALEERIFRDLAGTAAASPAVDPRDALVAGATAFLERTIDPVVRRIILIDAPAVLGWDRWREIDSAFGFGLLRNGLQRLATAGRIRPDDVEPYAHMLLASVLELALVMSRDPRPQRRLPSAAASIRALIEGLLPAR